MPKATDIDLPIEALADLLSKKIANLPVEVCIGMKNGEEPKLSNSLELLKNSLDSVLKLISDNE